MSLLGAYILSGGRRKLAACTLTIISQCNLFRNIYIISGAAGVLFLEICYKVPVSTQEKIRN